MTLTCFSIEMTPASIKSTAVSQHGFVNIYLFCRRGDDTHALINFFFRGIDKERKNYQQDRASQYESDSCIHRNLLISWKHFSDATKKSPPKRALPSTPP